MKKNYLLRVFLILAPLGCKFAEPKVTVNPKETQNGSQTNNSDNTSEPEETPKKEPSEISDESDKRAPENPNVNGPHRNGLKGSGRSSAKPIVELYWNLSEWGEREWN